ncbi:MAG: hypothetical protein E6J65_28050 [Deltaproteobacteria bacterium]|nr:MAG: hypothetical protein E6J65_28050 [Deltaproteobacteria bacterium]
MRACPPEGTTVVGKVDGTTEKWQVSVCAVAAVQFGEFGPESIRAAPAISVSEEACTPLPASWTLTCTSIAVDWLCGNHLICCPAGPTATPPFTVTPFTVGPFASMSS